MPVKFSAVLADNWKFLNSQKNKKHSIFLVYFLFLLCFLVFNPEKTRQNQKTGLKKIFYRKIIHKKAH